MSEHNYSIFAKFIYKFALIPINFLLLIYFVSSVAMIAEKWYFILPTLINALILYLINKYYFRNFKTMPYKIEINNELIKASKFVGSRKDFSFRMEDIEEIRGGIFGGSRTKPVHLIIKGHQMPVSFNVHISKFNELFTTILKNIDQKLYEELLESIKDRNIKFAEMIKAKKSKNKKQSGK